MDGTENNIENESQIDYMQNNEFNKKSSQVSTLSTVRYIQNENE